MIYNATTAFEKEAYLNGDADFGKTKASLTTSEDVMKLVHSGKGFLLFFSQIIRNFINTQKFYFYVLISKSHFFSEALGMRQFR